MNLCIGIISYLPNEEEVRTRRLEKLKHLLTQCNNIFNLPIIIIAQNWRDGEVNITNNCDVYYYPNPLNITGARKELRKKFLNSNYSNLIMLDDDIILLGEKDNGDKFKSCIASNPKGYGVFKERSLILFTISKELFSKIDYPNLEPSRGEIFEDIYLVMALEKLFSELKYTTFSSGLSQVSNPVNDPDSTWYHGQYLKHDIGDRTRELIKEL